MSKTKEKQSADPQDIADTQDMQDARGRVRDDGTEAREQASGRGVETLRQSPMMAHLLDALQAGEDIGHYGRLVFVMVARHFLDDDEIVKLLQGQPEEDEEKARARLLQVKQHDYNPPSRERILQWQKRNKFAICPTPDDPAACNVYRELQFPDGIYEHIEEFWEGKAEQEAHNEEGEPGEADGSGESRGARKQRPR